MYWYIAAALVLVLKFFVYAYYAGIMNTWFDKTNDKFRVSGLRIVLSLAFTGLNVLITTLVNSMGLPEVFWEVIPVCLSIVFAALAWFIILRVYYTYESTATMRKALVIGTILSAIFAATTGFLSFIGLLSSVNFC